MRFTVLERGKPLVVEVSGVDAVDLAKLKKFKDEEWPALLSIRVAGGAADLLGSYSVAGAVIRFESRYAPTPGVAFRATFDPKRLPSRPGGSPVAAEAALAKPPVMRTSEITHVYPSADKLPENQLRFYIHFSAPMTRGEAYGHIKLLDEDGKQVSRAFLELGQELWDDDRRRFTLLVHPGRVKRGLKPREELGPVLAEGKKYTLVVDEAWPDAAGNPLKSSFKKTFSVGAPDDSQPDPKNWRLSAPQAGDASPVELRFPKPLDDAMLQRMISVVDAAGDPVAGAIKVGANEARWLFTPAKAWAAGNYRLRIDTDLEDSCGNSIARPFELDLVQPRPVGKTRTVELPFSVK